MINKNYDSHIYPGEFVPRADSQKIINDNSAKKIPLVNLTELPELLKIEIALPGIEKEDILVESESNILSVVALNKKSENKRGQIFSLQEFNCEIFERKIALPKNADISFIHAEYSQGILKLHIPKSNSSEIIPQSKIIVY